MKPLLKRFLAVVLLITSIQFVNAQCAKNRIAMCKIVNCAVQKACVPNGLVKEYIANGWYTGNCVLPPNCGAVNNTKSHKKPLKAKATVKA
jgi:hypothetical protein